MPPTLLVVSFLVYLLVDLAPGDPAATLAGPAATRQEVEQVRHDYHLDDPLPVRYARWLGNAVQGDLGESYYTKQPVSSAIAQKLPINLSIALVAFAMTVVGG